MFQSTHSRGVRPPCLCHRVVSKMFQSTHSRGVRQVMILGTIQYRVSIHALTRSATRLFSSYRTEDQVSIHALTRSATICQFTGLKDKNGFNPRTHEECDGQIDKFYDYKFGFQSTHSRGVRPHIFFLFYFQIFRTRFSRIFLKNIKSKR